MWTKRISVCVGALLLTAMAAWADSASRAIFMDCLTGPGYVAWPHKSEPCLDYDYDYDTDIDLADFAEYQIMFSASETVAHRR